MKPVAVAPVVRAVEDDVAYQFKRLGAALRQQLDGVLRRQGVGLSMAHMAALFALEDEPGATGATLARHAMVTAQAMNTVLRRLERDGYIDRTPQPHNRHADCWQVTAAGRRQLARARTAGQPVFQRMLSPLRPREQAALRQLLARCVAALESGAAQLPVTRARSRPSRSSMRKLLFAAGRQFKPAPQRRPAR
ncbi:MAG: MarR family transcriptional regulator [Gammaproteobacteria bacterium]|nr:MarR family transcriptional regulator [Gammaproteobacteria bacterium]